MSGKTAMILTVRKFQPADIGILRYTLGSTLAMAIAMGFSWNLSFLLPVLSLGYFAPGAKPPTFKQGVLFVSTIVISSFLTLLFSKVFIDYKWVFIPVLGLALLHVFYTQKLAPQNKVFVLMTLLLIPMLAFISLEVAYAVANSIILGAVLTLVLVWTVHAVIPDVKASPDTPKTKQNVSKPAEMEVFTNALNTLIIVFPVVMVFFFFQWAGALLILIFIAILSMQPSFSFKAGMILTLGNLVGGIISIIVYEVLVMVPVFAFFITLIFFTGLFFSTRLFSGKKTAPLYGMAYSTMLLIIGQATTGTSDAGDKVWIRVVQIMIAVLYVVLAFTILNYFKERRLNRRKNRKNGH